VAAADAPLVWMDLEMSGLDPASCEILEVAVVVTDGDLNELAVGPHLIVHWPDAVLNAMDAWCTEHHGASGLTAAVRRSTLTIDRAAQQVLAFLQARVPKGASPLCGNSIHQDRAFIRKSMPEVDAHLHYRNVDVSTVKELVRRWYPALPPYQKRETHRALDDIRESISELRMYREAVFRPPE
jgi:oligoribonuclease